MSTFLETGIAEWVRRRLLYDLMLEIPNKTMRFYRE